MKKTAWYACLAVLLAVGFFACRTTAVELPENLTPAEIFQRAQEAVANDDYNAALICYQTFLERYPNDDEYVPWAYYEIAFLHHRMGDDNQAVVLFDELIARYQNVDAEGWPQAPLLLGQRVRDNIIAERPAAAGESAAAEAAPTPPEAVPAN